MASSCPCSLCLVLLPMAIGPFPWVCPPPPCVSRRRRRRLAYTSSVFSHCRARTSSLARLVTGSLLGNMPMENGGAEQLRQGQRCTRVITKIGICIADQGSSSRRGGGGAFVSNVRTPPFIRGDGEGRAREGSHRSLLREHPANNGTEPRRRSCVPMYVRALYVLCTCVYTCMYVRAYVPPSRQGRQGRRNRLTGFPFNASPAQPFSSAFPQTRSSLHHQPRDQGAGPFPRVPQWGGAMWIRGP